MRGEPLVVLGDLLAQVLLLGLEQRLGVALLEPADEEATEAADQVGDALEHGDLPGERGDLTVAGGGALSRGSGRVLRTDGDGPARRGLTTVFNGRKVAA